MLSGYWEAGVNTGSSQWQRCCGCWICKDGVAWGLLRHGSEGSCGEDCFLGGVGLEEGGHTVRGRVVCAHELLGQS